MYNKFPSFKSLSLSTLACVSLLYVAAQAEPDADSFLDMRHKHFRPTQQLESRGDTVTPAQFSKSP